MSRWFAPLLALILATSAGCAPDRDGDGWGRWDCDETRADVHPDAAEVCNGLDDDCDGWVDEDVSLLAYLDADADGAGDPAMARRVCALPVNGVENGDDCDDADPTVHPGAAEVCNGEDDDCDGEPDEGVATAWYADKDADGHGDPDAATTLSCAPPSGWSPSADDCDDDEPLAWSGAVEACDEVDNDCDGRVDEDLEPTRVWADDDGDGHGDPDVPGLACGDVTGWSTSNRDCDDTRATIGPQAAEVRPNDADEDCDGWIDEIAVPDPATPIAAALAIAAPGDVVQLGEGTWVGTVDLRGYDIILAGEGCEKSVVYGGGVGPSLLLDRGDVVDLTLSGGSWTDGGGVVVTGDAAAARICVEGNRAVRGGGVAVMKGSFTLEDSEVTGNTAADSGGGLFVAAGASLTVRRVHFADQLASKYGGGLYAEGTATVSASTFDADRAGFYGGAAAARTTGNLALRHVTVRGTRSAAAGQALYAYQSVVTVQDSVFVDLPAEGQELFYGSPTEIASARTVSWGNGSPEFDAGWDLDAMRREPRFLDDFLLGPGSPLIDAAAAGDTDPDGSRADLGAFGGPDAPAGFDAGYRADDDGDGLPDAWETHWGSNPWVADAEADDDADGLDAAAELAAATSPLHTDTDADGWPDGDEVAAGDDPLAPSDHAPVADAGHDRIALVGESVALSAAGSWDPNADPLTTAWTLTDAPDTSVAALTSPTDPDVIFTPDVVGRYTVTLEVDDGRGRATHTVLIDAVEALIVPDDADTLAEAIALAGDGSAIALRAGTWAGGVDLDGKDLVLFGLGAPADTVIDAGWDGPVIEAARGERPLIAQLTLANGAAERGAGLDAAQSGVDLRDVVIRDCFATGSGGGLYAKGTSSLVDVAFVGNGAQTGGGYAIDGAATLVRVAAVGNRADLGGGGWLTNGAHAVRASVFHRNTAPVGAGLWRSGLTGSLSATNVGWIHNDGENALYVENGRAYLASSASVDNAGVGVALGSTARVSFLASLAAGNATDVSPSSADPGTRGGNLREAPGFTRIIPNLDPGDDLWAGAPDAAIVNAGHPEHVDPDGSRADIGPAGGPDAPKASPTWAHDADGDGFSDGFERAAGLDPAVADAGGDADGDGLSDRAEASAGTAPDRNDTDSDGYSDAAEVAAGDDPLDPTDHQPQADAGADVVVQLGDDAVLDGSSSQDPDGAALTFAWAILGRPAGSGVTTADLVPSGASATFTPDVRGGYVLGLRVSDGVSTSDLDDVRVAVWDELDVPGDYATIALAAAAAVPYDEVVLGAGEFEGEVALADTTLTVRGAGAGVTTVLGGRGRPAFEITDGGALSLTDLAVEGGVANQGGAVYCNGASLTLDGVRLHHNVAYQGGALALDGCDATLTDLEVDGAIATDKGGAVWVHGGTVAITRGRFTENQAVTSSGGAIYAELRADLSLTATALLHNTAAGGGGAIYQSDGTTTLTQVTAAGNTNTTATGGVVLLGSGGSVSQSLFTDNLGYGLYLSSTSASKFTTTPNGFFGNGKGATYPTSLATAAGNVSGDPRYVDLDGGDARLRAESPMVDVGSTTGPDRDGSRSDLGAFGGPEAADGWSDWLVDTDGDDAPDGWEDAVGLDAADASDGAEDLDVDGLDAVAEYENRTAPDDDDTDDDGVIDGDEVADGDDPTDPTDHAPTASAGADRSLTTATKVTLDGSKSWDPDGKSVTCTWSFASAPLSSGLSDTDLTAATGCKASFTPDHAGAFEVRLEVDDGTATGADLVVIKLAGDLSVPDDYATVNDAVDAASDGAEIRIDAGTWDVTALDLGGRDLALTGAGADATVLDAGTSGGLLRATAGESLDLAGLTLTGGLAARGGAVWVDGGALTLDDVAFDGDLAAFGGGVYLEDGSLDGTDVVFVDSGAGRDGGGLYAYRSTVELVRVQFLGVRSGYRGGGAFVLDTALTITNAVFDANEADIGGGGLYTLVSSPSATTTKPVITLDHLTAADNRAPSGGFLYAYGTAVTIRNALIAGNVQYGETIQPYTTLSQSYTLMDDNGSQNIAMSGTSACCEPTLGTDGNENTDPGWVDLSKDLDWTNDDLSLAPGSAAIDAGTGGNDSDGSTADIGATGGPSAW